MGLFPQPGFVEISCKPLRIPSSAVESNIGTLRDHEYVTLKVFVSKHRQAQNEEKVYQHLRGVQTCHQGAEGIRFLKDHFQLPGKYGPHECLIHEPLGPTLKDIREMSKGEKVSEDLLKSIVKYLLLALDFLHAEGRVVHTG